MSVQQELNRTGSTEERSPVIVLCYADDPVPELTPQTQAGSLRWRFWWMIRQCSHLPFSWNTGRYHWFYSLPTTLYLEGSQSSRILYTYSNFHCSAPARSQ